MRSAMIRIALVVWALGVMEAGASRIQYDVALRDIKRVPTGTELSLIVYIDAACTEF